MIRLAELPIVVVMVATPRVTHATTAPVYRWRAPNPDELTALQPVHRDRRGHQRRGADRDLAVRPRGSADRTDYRRMAAASSRARSTRVRPTVSAG